MPKIKSYEPRPDSLAPKVAAHLQKAGGKISNSEIATRFNVGKHNVSALLKKAVAAGWFTVSQIAGGRSGFAYELGNVKVSVPAQEGPIGSPFTNPPVGIPDLAPGQIEISNWSDGEVYIHGLHVASDGSVLFTLAQMRKLVLHMTDPLGLRR